MFSVTERLFSLSGPFNYYDEQAGETVTFRLPISWENFCTARQHPDAVATVGEFARKILDAALSRRGLCLSSDFRVLSLAKKHPI